MAARVIVLWGDNEIQSYYDFSAWTQDTARRILQNTEVYDFDTEDEAEAFRMGLCAVKTPSAKDFTELPPRGFASLQSIAKRHNAL